MLEVSPWEPRYAGGGASSGAPAPSRRAKGRAAQGRRACWGGRSLKVRTGQAPNHTPEMEPKMPNPVVPGMNRMAMKNRSCEGQR